MVDALVSGASAERRVGSSPILGTSKEFSFRKLLFCLPRIELGQLVAPLLQYLLCLLCSRLLPPVEPVVERKEEVFLIFNSTFLIFNSPPSGPNLIYQEPKLATKKAFSYICACIFQCSE